MFPYADVDPVPPLSFSDDAPFPHCDNLLLVSYSTSLQFHLHIRKSKSPSSFSHLPQVPTACWNTGTGSGGEVGFVTLSALRHMDGAAGEAFHTTVGGASAGVFP